MKSAILTKSKEPLEIADINLPEKLDVGQVQVKIHYSGICGDGLDYHDNILYIFPAFRIFSNLAVDINNMDAIFII